MKKWIFVYGSLMEGFFNYNTYLKGKVISRKYARTKGILYHLINKGYPALIEGEGYVYGELIEIKNFKETLMDLDELENYFGDNNRNNEYNRVLREIEVLEDGTKHKVFLYMYNCTNKEKMDKENIRIPNGSWREYMNEKRVMSL